MKKLMIAAAAAAMVSGVFAYNGVPTYDFSAQVKTTGARAGFGSISLRTVNLGVVEYATGIETWWYEDPIVLAGIQLATSATAPVTFASWSDAKMFILRMTTEQKQALVDYLELAAVGLKDVDGDEVLWTETVGAMNRLNWGFQTVYNGFPQWCGSFFYLERSSGSCYRVSASKRLVGELEVDSCCSATSSWEFTRASERDAEDEGWLNSLYATSSIRTNVITPYLIDRFGSDNQAQARTVEFAGEIGDFTASSFVYGGWALAGQGQWDVSNELITSINGDIVGTMLPDECADCCSSGSPALYFVCTDPVTGVTSEAMVGKAWGELGYIGVASDLTPMIGLNNTAAFGTWSVRYNSRKTFAAGN